MLKNPIYRITLLHVAVTVVASALLVLILPFKLAASFFWGGLFFSADFFLLGLAWGFIFSKRLAAVAVFVSICKFAILGVILYNIVNSGGIHALWFGAGCAIFALTALIEAIVFQRPANQENE